MTEFLAENNQCGQNLILLTSRGNAIIAELRRLADFIPPALRQDNRQDQIKYNEILCDFSYFKNQEQFDCRIDAKLVSILKENHLNNHEFLLFLLSYPDAF